MTLFNIITILVVLAVVFTIVRSFKGQSEIKNLPLFQEDDYVKKPNDKRMLIEGPIYHEVENACKAFCREFNETNTQVIIRLIRIDAERNLLIFPYDINFKHYCYLLNFLKQPNPNSKKSRIRGWLTAKEKDLWIQDDLTNSAIMVYLLDHESACNYVYASSVDKQCYKFMFDFQKETLLMPTDFSPYQNCPVNLEEYSLGQGKIIT